MKARTFDLRVEEGVELTFERAGTGERAGAFAIDALLAFIGLIVGGVAMAALGFSGDRGVWQAGYSLFAFFTLFFYFGWCEAGRRGATPGKRLLGLRVIDSRGRALTPHAAFVRNVVRWIEIAGPLSLLGAASFDPNSPTRGADLLLYGALTGLSAVPFVRADGRRLGDLAAGTLVVRAPRAALSRELVAPREAAAAVLAFADAELDVYGERELHALEALLRSETAGSARLVAAARIIAKKIGREAPAENAAREWLAAFYAAQRGRLERRLVVGRRKRDKFDRR